MIQEQEQKTYGTTNNNDTDNTDINSLSTERKFKRETLWKCFFCGSVDKRVVEFTSQFIICIIIMGFCISQLSKGGLGCEEGSLYQSLLTMVIGLVLPNPKMK